MTYHGKFYHLKVQWRERGQVGAEKEDFLYFPNRPFLIFFYALTLEATQPLSLGLGGGEREREGRKPKGGDETTCMGKKVVTWDVCNLRFTSCLPGFSQLSGGRPSPLI